LTQIPTVEYFKKIFCTAWDKFKGLEEQEYLHTSRSNITTIAYCKTGILYPFNPNCILWERAIKTLGSGCTKEDTVAYEYKQRHSHPKLTKDEVQLMTNKLDSTCVHMEGKEFMIATVLAKQILAKWREKFVSLTEAEDEAATNLLPDGFITTDGKKTATKILEFKKVDMSMVNLEAQSKTEQGMQQQITKQIIQQIDNLGTIQLVQYVTNEDASSVSSTNKKACSMELMILTLKVTTK
jgi:hypothetical protein